MLLLLLLTSAFVLLPWTEAARIIGGREVKPHSRPYMAYLKIKSGSESSSCGGFLIRPDVVLSAAHCVAKQGTVSVTVTLGAHNIRDQEWSQQVIPVARWIIHPEYCPVGFKNDIVLLKLETEAEINEDVECISIARSNEHVKAGTKCSVSGWGWTSTTGQKTDVMREVELEVQNDAICQRRFPNYQHESMICAGDEDNKNATNKGDSGGPLVCNQKAHGIVSHGTKHYLFPEVFTKISHFESWIHEQLRKFALQELPGSPSSD